MASITVTEEQRRNVPEAVTAGRWAALTDSSLRAEVLPVRGPPARVSPQREETPAPGEVRHFQDKSVWLSVASFNEWYLFTGGSPSLRPGGAELRDVCLRKHTHIQQVYEWNRRMIHSV